MEEKVTSFTAKEVIPDSEIIKNDETGIPDKALYDLILKAVRNDSDGVFTKDEAMAVYDISTNYNDDISIKDLKGIEYCRNLSTIGLRNNNQISDISPIKNLTN